MRWTLAAGLAFWTATAQAQGTGWRPIAPPPEPLAVSLGRPIVADDSRTAVVQPASYTADPVVRLQAPAPPPSPDPLGWQPNLTPVGAAPLPQSWTSNQGPSVVPPPPGGELFSGGPAPGAPPPPGGFPGSGSGLFGCEALGCFSGPERRLFQSDHAFDNFISPVSNPFLFEDPRALTEVRPIFIYQQTPAHNYLFRGGDIEFFGTQARVAVTDRLSFVMNKFGWIWDEPHSPGTTGLLPHAGLSEIWLGPKYTFLRSDSTGTVAAGGLTFQIPAGPAKVAQNTGTMSMVPYLSLAQNFAQNFNFLSTLGYSFATDNQRSDYLFWSWHVDYDIGGLHRFYPLVELNWFHVTSAGTARGLGFEGQDLFNFGSMATSGQDSLSLAFGGRVKINEFTQVGLAIEFPLIASPLMAWRTTLDLIIRY
jgi:hypothetical protein